MKIKNNLVLVFCVVGFLLGLVDGLMAYDEEIRLISRYSTDYSIFKNNFVLFVFLVFRYLKYILVIYVFSVGFLSKFICVVISMIKSYFYSFILVLMFIAFDGFLLFTKTLMVVTQMTLSLVVTIVFAQVIMNCIEGRYFSDKKTIIGFLAFVFSFICCIIIGMVDFIIIQLMF